MKFLVTSLKDFEVTFSSNHVQEAASHRAVSCDAMDLRDFDHRVMCAHSYEALPPSPESLWSAWTSLAQSVPSSDVKDMDKGCWITNALQEHALALHQMTLKQGVVNTPGPRCLEPLISPCEMCGTCPSSSCLRNSSRSACLLAPTFIENLEHTNAAVFQHCEDVKEQC